jgi:hypothetical protein
LIDVIGLVNSLGNPALKSPGAYQHMPTWGPAQEGSSLRSMVLTRGTVLDTFYRMAPFHIKLTLPDRLK